MSATRFALADIVPTPWKNGGGATREIACWPPGTGLDSFDWRISVATIAAIETAIPSRAASTRAPDRNCSTECAMIASAEIDISTT